MTEFSTLRQAAALSIPQAAKIVGVATSTAYRWEHGEVPATPDGLERLRARVARPAVRPDAAFTFIELFAGIGGLRRGFDAIGGRCVFTSEWNKFAEQTYRANYYDGPDHKFAGDITKVEAEDVPVHDVLLAGFPCQPSSHGLHRRTSDKTADRPETLGPTNHIADSGLDYFNVMQIILEHAPKAFLFEVPLGLTTTARGTLDVMQQTLEQRLGYTLSSRTIDAAGLVPLHRKRLFITGVRNDFGPMVDLTTLSLPGVIEGPRLGSILHRQDGTETDDLRFVQAGSVNSRYTLSDRLWQYLRKQPGKQLGGGIGVGVTTTGPDDRVSAFTARYCKDGSEILLDQGQHRNPRRLTPRECSRLVGFDEAGGSDFLIPVSDTQAYLQFANATAVPIAEAIARHMQLALFSISQG